MKRGLRIGLLAIAALGVACRGIVGIEDLTVSDGGGVTPGTDAGDAGGGGDAAKEGSVPPGPPAPPGVPPMPPPPPGDAGECHVTAANFPDCMACCRNDNAGQLQAWDDTARTAGCLCDASTCQSSCQADLCAATPVPPGPTCFPCFDPWSAGVPQHTGQECDNARTTCGNGTTCRDIVACFLSCRGKQ